jgi:2-polyprenyl-3-methyl-5-hydroxy-6-metoxy-1,4-benzoquinol methylase
MQRETFVYQRYHAQLLKLIQNTGRTFSSVMDVGCADGSGAQILRELGAKHLVGLEISPEAALLAQKSFDQVLVGDALDCMQELHEDAFDLIICADVLEHLYDPWSTLKRCHQLLKSGGMIAISVPNLSHVGNLKNIFLQGKFDFMGDSTHIRLLAYYDILDLLKTTGQWKVEAVVHDIPTATRAFTKLTAQLLTLLSRSRMPLESYLAMNVWILGVKV